MKLILNKKNQKGKLFLNIIDCEIKGKILEDDNKKIDLNNIFYDGIETEEEEILNLVEKAYSIQFIGNKSVDFAIKNNIIKEYLEIKKIKYAFLMN